MATSTFGTTAQTSLTAIMFLRGYGSVPPADMATINNALRSPNAAQKRLGEGLIDSTGVLQLPGKRGVIKVMPGDYVAVDSQGWPIVVSAYSIANSTWIHSP